MANPIIKKDTRGNKIYSKDASGYEQFWDFDEKNRFTKWHDSNGQEEIITYDEYNRPIYMKGKNGFELHQRYEGTNTFIIYPDGTEKGIDNKNRVFYQKDPNGKIHRWKH